MRPWTSTLASRHSRDHRRHNANDGRTSSRPLDNATAGHILGLASGATIVVKGRARHAHV